MKMRINLPSNSNYDRLTRLEAIEGYSNIYASDLDRVIELERVTGNNVSPGVYNNKSIKERIFILERLVVGSPVPPPVNYDFYLKITSPSEPVVPPDIYGTISVSDNGDGTWDLISEEAITEFILSDIGGYQDITEVIVNYCGSLTTMKQMFHFPTSQLVNLHTITFADTADTSGVTSMTGAFEKCSALTTVNFGTIDTSNVTHMGLMFSEDRLLTTLSGFGSLDVSKVTDMGSMFMYSGIKTLDLTAWTPVSCTSCYSMFKESDIETLDITGWQTPLCRTVGGMFNLSKITTFNFDGWDTSGCTDFGHMFENADNITSFDFSGLDVSAAESMNQFCMAMSNVTSIIAPDFSNSACTDFVNIFRGCTLLESLTMSDLNPAVTNKDLSFMFENCASLTCINKLDTTAASLKTGLFNDCPVLTQPDAAAVADLMDTDGAAWVNPGACPEPRVTFRVVIEMVDGGTLPTIMIDNSAIPDTNWVATGNTEEYAYTVREGEANITRFGLTGGSHHFLDLQAAEHLTVADYLFFEANSLTSAVISTTPPLLTDITYLFGQAKALTSLDLSAFDMSGITSAGSLFEGSDVLEEVTLNNLSFSAFGSQMFSSCGALKSINFIGSTGEISDASNLFNSCESLVCVSNLTTAAGANTAGMFDGATALAQPDASEQALLLAGGHTWVNANPCPQIVYGDNIFVNGEFTTDLDGWTIQGGTPLWVDGGFCDMNGDGKIYQHHTVTAGIEFYELNIRLETLGSTPGEFKLSSNSNGLGSILRFEDLVVGDNIFEIENPIYYQYFWVTGGNSVIDALIYRSKS